MAAACAVVIGLRGSSFEAEDQHARFVANSDLMSKKAPERELRGSELTAATAEKVFGWKNVHKHDGELIGKKQDKLGRWRLSKVPDYSGDPTQAYAIDERMKQLGRGEAYVKELARDHESSGFYQQAGRPQSSEAGRRLRSLP